jgi:hypothetical protein
LKFERVAPKEWKILYKDESIPLRLVASTVTNKYEIVTSFIERVAEFHGEAFSDWFVQLLKDCQDIDNRAEIFINNIQQLKVYVDEYLESTNVNYDSFVDITKAKKSSILFDPTEIKNILRLSCYLKVYSVISNNQELAFGKSLHKEIYNKLADNVIQTDVASKLFDVIKTKTFRYNLSDKFMWDYIKTIQCKDIGSHIIEIFNFIMNYILVLCEEDKNPITYFVGVIDQSVKWILRSVYKGTIVYDDSISTEDIHGININNLLTYSFNDTLGRMKAVAFEKIHTQLEKTSPLTMDDDVSDRDLIEFNNRIEKIEYISPLCTSLVFPLLSKMTDISYVHFKTISPDHAAILSYYLHGLLQKVFKGEYKNLFSLLEYYPLSQPSLNTTYKIKSIHEYVNIKDINFYGFQTKILPHKILCHFIGRVSRINFCHLLTGNKLSGIPLSKVEVDMIIFYTQLFSGKIEHRIEQLTRLMNQDF